MKIRPLTALCGLFAVATGILATGFATPQTPTDPDALPIPANVARGARATAFIWVSTACPISNRYAPFMSALAQNYNAQGVQVVLVYANRGTTDVAAAKHAKAFKIDALPRFVDHDQKFTRLAGATVTPQAVIIGSDGHIRYRGRLDDGYVARGKARAAGAERHELTDALDALVAGRAILVSQTSAVGCAIEWNKPSKTSALQITGPTYADVAPILNENCVACHRSGEIGPMRLDTYADASRYAGNIVQVTQAHLMPPWKPVKGHGDFNGERRLTDTQMTTLAKWAKLGAPLGDPKKVPPAPTFAEGWQLGKPDLILTMPEKWVIKANDPDLYRCFVLPTGLTEDKEVVAVEYRAGNKSIVHHVLGYVDTQGKARAKDAADAGAGYTSFGGPGFSPHGEMGGWAPGNMPHFLPDGIARLLPAGSDLVIQLHYHADGKPEEDLTQVGLYFAKKPIVKKYRVVPVAGTKLDIPPGEKSYTITQTYPVPVDATVLDVTPHMHYLGRTFAMEATLPDGTVKPLIKIDDWDFQWQDTYTFKEPVRLPKGSTVSLTATYDNSTDNPRNPNFPPKRVGWGEATTDEMCIGFLGFTADDENAPLIRLLDAARKRKASK